MTILLTIIVTSAFWCIVCAACVNRANEWGYNKCAEEYNEDLFRHYRETPEEVEAWLCDGAAKIVREEITEQLIN